jgi:hypothetical protein
MPAIYPNAEVSEIARTYSSSPSDARLRGEIDLFVATLQYRWVPLPKPGKKCGLGRSKINTLILPTRENNFRPPVKSASLRQPGQQKAARVIHLASLLAYLEICTAIEESQDLMPKPNPRKNQNKE